MLFGFSMKQLCVCLEEANSSSEFFWLFPLHSWQNWEKVRYSCFALFSEKKMYLRVCQFIWKQEPHLVVWWEEIRAFVSMKNLGWLKSVKGSESGREEFVGRQSPVKTEIGWERSFYLWEQKLTFQLDPCCFLTAFPFGPWLSSRLYVILKDYFCPFVLASGKLKVS